MNCITKFLQEHEEYDEIFEDIYRDEVVNCSESYGFDPDDEDFCDQWGEYDNPFDWYEDHAHNVGYMAAYEAARVLLYAIREEHDEVEFDPDDEDNQVYVCEHYGVATSW